MLQREHDFNILDTISSWKSFHVLLNLSQIDYGEWKVLYGDDIPTWFKVDMIQVGGIEYVKDLKHYPKDQFLIPIHGCSFGGSLNYFPFI